MKKLFLIRHAKSSWDSHAQSDIERPLNNRGEQNALMMSKILMKENILPELLLSSPALRALSTAKIFAGQFGIDQETIVIEKSIYEAGIRELSIIVDGIDDRYDSVFLFGHNPGLSAFTNLIGDKFIPEMPTCAIAGLEFNINRWSKVARGAGRLFLFDYPKKHSK
ncbi:MAG: phosphohistidine phosphatase [Ignavibacteriae bacterium HGW-Ignavibacteriae-3]|nr:MAG: phosphohistidine phosphatase [Ignavibacteriae bacterium HGW-Ignavibacteriae-3]